MKAVSKKVKTTLKTPSGNIVYKKKVGAKMQAVNYRGNPVVVAATPSALKKNNLPQRVQAKSMMKQGYKARGNESVAMKNKGKKTQSYKARLNEREGMRRRSGNSPLRLK